MLKVEDFEKMFPWPEIELASYGHIGYQVRLVASLPFYRHKHDDGDEVGHEVYYWILETQNGRTSEIGFEDLGDAISIFNQNAKSDLFDE